MLYRLIGLASAALCVLWLLISFIVSVFTSRGDGHSWFNNALIFALLFVVGNGIAAILEKLERERRSA